MTAPSRKETISSRVLADLRQSILRGELAPDARINLDHLRDRFQSSISPLREALARLTGDGLVRFEDQKGFRVAPVSRTEFADLAALHVDLSVTALRGSITAGGIDWESGVIRALHRLNRTDHDGDAAGWSVAHAAFHQALIAGAARPLLLQSCVRLADLVSRYRVLTGTDQPTAEDAPEHDRLSSLTAQRQTDQACTALRDHFDRERDRILHRLG